MKVDYGRPVIHYESITECTGGITVKRSSWLRLLTLATILAVFLTACGGGGNSNNQGSNSSGNTNTSNGSNGEAGNEKVTITMIVSGNRAADGEDFELDILPRMVNEKYPHITLEVQKLPDDQYETNIMTKLAAGEAPDIFRIWPRMASMGVIDTAKAGYLADLSDLPFQQYISQGAREDMSYDGKIYGITKGDAEKVQRTLEEIIAGLMAVGGETPPTSPIFV